MFGEDVKDVLTHCFTLVEALGMMINMIVQGQGANTVQSKAQLYIIIPPPTIII